MMILVIVDSDGSMLRARAYLSFYPSVNTVKFTLQNRGKWMFWFQKAGATCKVQKIGVNIQLKTKTRTVLQLTLYSTVIRRWVDFK